MPEDPSVLATAIRAQERADSAHKRLDGINGSIDKLNGKVDIVDSKLDSVLITLATQAGAEGMKAGFLESRKFWIGTVALLATSSLATLIFTLLTRHPN